MPLFVVVAVVVLNAACGRCVVEGTGIVLSYFGRSEIIGRAACCLNGHWNTYSVVYDIRGRETAPKTKGVKNKQQK